MRTGYKVTLSVLTVMILITITIGTSYSYYSISKEQTNPNELTTTCFKVDFTEGNSISMNSDGKYAYPMSETKALTKDPYQFTITNTCTTANSSSDVKFDITLNTLTATPSTLTNNLKFKLNTTAPTAVTGTTTSLTANPYNMASAMKTEHGIDASYSLLSGTLAPGQSKTFKLYLWIDEAAGNEVMGKTFTGKVLIYNYL